MIDPDRLDPDARDVWDEMFPDGFWAGAPHIEGPYVRLFSYAYVCQTLELGYVPAPVDEVLTASDHQAVGTYWKNRSESQRSS